ncbi:MAG TPA: hypothetical protein VFZ82_11955 [Methylomirabilota bacterium]|nr:hypothetical protein [Methylomirabilota bacterium]
MSRRTAPAVWEARNAVVASGLAPLLVLTGALGFALPPHLALLSGASPAGWSGSRWCAGAGVRGRSASTWGSA